MAQNVKWLKATTYNIKKLCKGDGFVAFLACYMSQAADGKLYMLLHKRLIHADAFQVASCG